MKMNRNSISTSDDTLVTERSMGNTIEMKGDASSVDIKADAYDKYHEKFYGKADAEEKDNHVPPETHTDIPSASRSPSQSDSSGDVRGTEEGDGQLRSTMDEDRVKRVLHQLAIECDRQSNPSTPTAPRHSAQAAQRQAAATRAAPPPAASPAFHSNTDKHGPSSPPPAMSMGGRAEIK